MVCSRNPKPKQAFSDPIYIYIYIYIYIKLVRPKQNYNGDYRESGISQVQFAYIRVGLGRGGILHHNLNKEPLK